MEKAKEEDKNNKLEEVFIIRSPDAVIEPPTMMIKIVHTSITLPTMLRVVKYVSFTNFTVKGIVSVIEILSINDVIINRI